MDQVAAAVGHESVPAKILRKRVATVNGNAGRAGKITGGPASAFDGAGKEARHTPARANDTPRFIRADAINLRRRAVGGDVQRGRRHGEERIATGVTVLIHHFPNVSAIAANELASVIVEAQPVLASAALQAHRQSARVEGKIVAAQVQRFRISDFGFRIYAHPPLPGAGEFAVHQIHLAAITAVGRVNAIGEAPREPVEQRLHV